VLYGRGWSSAGAGALAMGVDTATWQREEGEFDGTATYGGFFGQVPFWMDGRLRMERQAPEAGDSLQTSANWQGFLYGVSQRYYAPVGRANFQNALPEIVLTPEEELNLGIDRGALIDYITQASREFVTGERSVDADWDDYVSSLNELGLQDFVDAMQQALIRE